LTAGAREAGDGRLSAGRPAERNASVQHPVDGGGVNPVTGPPSKLSGDDARGGGAGRRRQAGAVVVAAARLEEVCEREGLDRGREGEGRGLAVREDPDHVQAVAVMADTVVSGVQDLPAHPVYARSVESVYGFDGFTETVGGRPVYGEVYGDPAR